MRALPWLGGLLLLALVGCAPAPHQEESKVAAHKEVWTCSMHPQIRQDHPGRCPICGMNLVKLEASDAAPQAVEPVEPVAAHNHAGAVGAPVSGEVTLDAVQSTQAQLQLAEVKKEFLKNTLTLFGEVKYIQDRHVDFTWVYGGRIEKVLIPYNTTQVGQGQPLLEVYSQEAIADEQAYLQAVRDRTYTTFTERKIASAQVELMRQKLLRAGMTAEQLGDLIGKKQIKTTFTLKAPITGAVVGMLPAVGEQFSADKGLFHLSNLDEVWFAARVYETDIGRVQLGQVGQLRLKAYPEKSFEGAVVFVDRFLDPASRTLEVRLNVKNAEKLLLPEMSGEVGLVVAAPRAVLVVPESAIIDTGKRKIVYVAQPKGSYRPTEVKVGAKSQDWVEILMGVTEGEKVVSAGAFIIDAEAQLKGAQQN